MDLYVEQQCVDKMKAGEVRQFLNLFDANFVEVYKYVARRVADSNEVERIVRLAFLDGFGQIQNTPTDISYLIWLYSLAKPRVWEYLDKASFPEKQGLISTEESLGQEGSGVEVDTTIRANKMMGKLSLEEREILRLKLFEQVTDGDVTMILGLEEGIVGSKIYRVLKRAYFFLFGESDEKQGVYFGELSGFFEKLREGENIEIPEVFKLGLKADFANRIERKDFAINGKVVEEKGKEERVEPFLGSFSGVGKKPFEVKAEEVVGHGANDPAKIFVEAVKEMREEEAEKKQKETEKFEKREKLYDVIDKWKPLFALIPGILFILVIVIVLVSFVDFGGGNGGKVLRGYPDTCEVEVVFDGDFGDNEKRQINKAVSNKLCDDFDVETLLILRKSDTKLEVELDVEDWFLEYTFVKRFNKNWRIKRYAKTFSGDEQSGQV